MENLNLVNAKYAIEMLRHHGVSNGGTLGFHACWCDIAADQLEAALALIKELTEENERLRAIPEQLHKEMSERMIEERKIERKLAVRKMQERFKSCFEDDVQYDGFRIAIWIDQIAKEILEGDNENQ